MLEPREHLPVGLRHVGAALELALDDDRQGRALHAADGEEVGAEAAGRERDGAGQRRAPDQVDVLARLAGAGERLGELVEVGEGALDLLLGERRVAGALDAGAVGGALAEPSSGLTSRISSSASSPISSPSRSKSVAITTSSASLASLRERLEDVLLGRLLDQLGVDQLVRLDLPPLRVALGEGGVQQWPLRPIACARLAVGPGVVRDPVAFVLLGCRRRGSGRSSWRCCPSR